MTVGREHESSGETKNAVVLPCDELGTGDEGRDLSKHWKRVFCVNFIVEQMNSHKYERRRNERSRIGCFALPMRTNSSVFR